MFDSLSDDPFLFLLQLSHADWGQDYFIVNNLEDITSNGQLYNAYAMKVTLPQTSSEVLPSVNIQVDNVSLELIEFFRSITTPISATLKGILASDPDVIEISLDDLKINNIQYNDKTIDLTLIVDNWLNQKIPGEVYSPELYPGLFK